ncbi:MAG: PAS domain S-box protein [Calditrichaceae bacterium]
MNYNSKTKKELISEIEKLNKQLTQFSSKKKTSTNKTNGLLNSIDVNNFQSERKAHQGINSKIVSENEINEVLQMMQSAIENANIGVLQVDDDGCIHYANEYARQSLGYTMEELSEICIVDIDTKFDLPAWKINREIIQAGGLDTVESVFRRKDGSTFSVEVNIDFIEFKGRNLSFSFVKDITDRKEAEKQLKESNERLELALNGTGAGLWDWNLETGEIVVGKRFEEILGYKFYELQPRTIQKWMRLLHPDDLLESKKILRKHLAGEIDFFEHESRIKHKSGHWIWILNRGKISELDAEGKPVRITGTHLDITRRRLAEEKIRDSEEKYRSLLNNQNDAIFLHKFRPEGFSNFSEVNDIACKRYGYTRDEFLKLSPPLITKKEDVNSHARADHRNQLLTEGHIIFETEHITKAGKYFPVEISSNIIDFKGEKYILAVVRDISERKLLQGQLQQAQKMEAIGQLAGGVAHDFNNLLTIINGYCELLMFRELPDNIQGLIKEIQAAGSRAGRLTGQLLAFSRKQIIQPEIVNLNKLISDQMKMLGRLLGEDIEISILLNPDLGNTKADPGQLEQIIMNIAINARDAMPFGGKLTIETNNKTFDKRFLNSHLGAKPGKYVALAISDNGVGMDKGTLDRIFEPFFTTKGRDKGTGLGLATVYGIVKQNNGYIYVYSEPQKGTSFKLYLPLIEKNLQNSDKIEDERESLAGNETVLLAEDDSGVRKVTHKTLESYGYTVLVASNGEEAVRIFKENKNSIDLLLTDVVMPLMSGNELADKLLKDKSSLKVLYFSGYTDDSIVKHGILAEGMEFLQKPYTHVELAKKIKTILSKK